MKILIIDRDEITVQLLKSKLEPLDHHIDHIESKNDAPDLVAKEKHNLIILDPAPLTSAKPININIRRSVGHYPYILMCAQNMAKEQALKDSANDLIPKPIDHAALLEKVENAGYLVELIRRIGDTSEDFPSAGGVIAKSAFNQLFLSAIDRADRYAENSYIIFITIENYREIKELDGPYAADYASANLSKALVRMRRQSDIIAQTGKAEFALLLQRPLYETEPLEAANRFAESLGKETDLVPETKTKLDITVRLINTPMGETLVSHRVNL